MKILDICSLLEHFIKCVLRGNFREIIIRNDFGWQGEKRRMRLRSVK